MTASPTTSIASPGFPHSAVSPIAKMDINDPAFSRAFAVFDDITQPEQDAREYRLLTLANKVRVLLVSDPETEKAAAAADIHVGSLSDPDDIPGLAHFLEHLLFMGTEKYPVENDYSQYLASHGGMSNAYTAEEHTNYYFEVTSDHLEGALDRFAQFFVSPLFSESGTEREMNAVDSEHKKNLQNDGWRIFQLEKQLSNPNHVYRKFGTGNLETLGKLAAEKGYEIRKTLINFHQKYYSSNIMTAVILGKEPLDTLTEWAVDKFCAVMNKDVDFPRFEGSPLTQEQLGLVINIKPVKDVRHMDITFPIPETRKWYKSQPCHYLSHLLGHEGKGSILSLLKIKGWAVGLSAGALDSSDNFDFFKISIDLTKEGILNYENIIEIVFAYIEIIRKEGLQEWIFKELKQLELISFRFKEKSGAAYYVSNLSNAMHHYDNADILSGPYLLKDYDESKIKHILKYLNTDNFRVTLINSDFEVDQEWSKGDWYETPYRVQKFSEVLKSQLSNTTAESVEGLAIPLKNPFIPDNLDVVRPPKGTERTNKPKIIMENEFYRLWHKKDDTFFVPKAQVFLSIITPLAYSTPKNFVMSSIYVDLVQDALNEISYDASCAGLNYSLTKTTQGLVLAFQGYNDKLATLLEKIVYKMKNLEVKEDRFKFIYEQTERQFRNWYMDAPVNHAVSYSTYLLQEKLWLQDEKIEALKEVTPESIQEFYPELLRRSYIEGFVHGNIDKETSISFLKYVEEHLVKEPLTPFERLATIRSSIPPKDANVVQIYEVPNDKNVNSAIEFILHVGYQSDEDIYSHGNLLGQLASEPVFDQLRTQEQLGYMVFTGVRKHGEIFGFRIIIQSERDPVYLESRIENMIVLLRANIEALKDEDFEKHKAALVVKVLEKEKNLAEESQHLWSHIVSKRYDFDRKTTHAEAIKKITKESLLAYYDKYISADGELRRKMSTHLRSQINGEPKDEELSKIYLNPEKVQIVKKEHVPELKLSWELSRGPIPQNELDTFRDEDVKAKCDKKEKEETK